MYGMHLLHFFLYNTAGAMRIPGNGDPDWDENGEGPCHYLSDFYVNHFKLNTIRFFNSDPEKGTFYKFYGKERIQKKGIQKKA